MDGRPSDAGFTLLEIMVALVVFGLLVLGLGQGVDFGLRAWGRQTGGVAGGLAVKHDGQTLLLLARFTKTGVEAETPDNVFFVHLQ